MNIEKEIKVELLARFEIGWWKAHHRKQKKLFIENMKQLYILQFGLSELKALMAVKYRLTAADFHDKAEAYEDAKNQSFADLFWNKAEKSLQKHFKILEGYK